MKELKYNSTITVQRVNPAYHVTEHTPPTFLWATADDNMIPVQNTLRISRTLSDAGVPYELHIFEHDSHGLSLAT